MGKLTENKNEKFEKLIGAAFELFDVKDISAVSIDEIVKKAGVAKGTFYLYFKNKPDLIAKLILKKAAEYLKDEGIYPEVEDDADFGKYVKLYMDLLTDFLEKNKTLTKLIDKNVHVCVRALLENAQGAFGDLYEKIEGYFLKKGLTQKEITIKMHIYLEMTVSACCNAILRENPATIEEVKPHIYDIVTLSLYHTEQQKEAKN